MRWLIISLMVLGLSACGKKGDLLPPGGEGADAAQVNELEDATHLA